MPPHTYRLATPADLDPLVTLRAAFLAEVRGANPSDPALLATLRDYFSSTLPTHQFIAYLALDSTHIVATSGLVFHRHPPRSSDLNRPRSFRPESHDPLVDKT